MTRGLLHKGRVGLGILWTLWPGTALAVSANDALECLQQSDLVCAQEIEAELERDRPGSVDLGQVRVWNAFHQGDYLRTMEEMERLRERGTDLEVEESRIPYRGTAEASRGMESHRGEGVEVRVSPGVDRIVAEEAVDALIKIRQETDGLFGGGPEHTIILDVFATGTRFIGASGLPPEAVQTTGVVALSKWTRLLLTSPRALSRGYAWRDTVAHEYIHLVVSFRSEDQAPVWLQEGLAKFLESHWEDGATGELTIHHQSLLAEAVRTGDFVPFEKFKYSMAYLDSGEEAALAFSQVATMVQYMTERGGMDVLPVLMDRLADGETAESAVAGLAGHSDFESFRQGWLEWLRTQRLASEDLSSLPVVLDGAGDEFDSDPLLSQRPDLARYTRLGDLLLQAERPKAALIEYEKAVDPDEPPSPLLMSRKAQCLADLERVRDALGEAQEGVRLYPEFAPLQVIYARMLELSGRSLDARKAWAEAHNLNPYDPEVQDALVRLYGEEGNSTAQARHERYAHILATGGLMPEETAEESR
jgi:tetratricopeptide (TPR) repeat protein